MRFEESDKQNDKQFILYYGTAIMMVLLWAFVPSIISITSIYTVVASGTWMMFYTFEDSSFSFSLISNISPFIILHSLRLLFILYVIASLERKTRFKVTVLFGFLTEIPIIILTAYYTLFPQAGYSATLALPIPIVALTGIFVLARKRHIRTIQGKESETHRTGIDADGNLNHTS